MGERVWQTAGGGDKTALQMAQEFARTHWAEPRKIRNFTPDGLFSLVRGLRMYRIFMDGDLWVVEVVEVKR